MLAKCEWQLHIYDVVLGLPCWTHYATYYSLCRTTPLIIIIASVSCVLNTDKSFYEYGPWAIEYNNSCVQHSRAFMQINH